MRKISVESAEQDGLAALSLMEGALRLLDRSGGALEAGADLDSAICRLREFLGPLAPATQNVPLAVLEDQAASIHRARSA